MKKIIALIAILALLGTQVGAVEPRGDFETSAAEQTEVTETPAEEEAAEEEEVEEEAAPAEKAEEEAADEEEVEEPTEEVDEDADAEEAEEEEPGEETPKEEAFEAEITEEASNAKETEKAEIADGGEVSVKKNTASAVTVNVPADGATFEFEDLYPDLSAPSKMVEDAAASGGEYLRNGYADASVSGTYPLTFTVEESGTYTVKFRCNMVGYNLSSIKFKIDDNEFVDNKNNTDKTHVATTISTGSLSQPNAEYLHDFITEMELTAGEHTMSLSLSGWESVGSGRNAYAIDCLSIYRPKAITSVRADAKSEVMCGEDITPVMYNQDDKTISLQDYDSVEYTTTTPEILKIDGGKITALNHGTGEIKATVKVGDEEYTDTKTVSVAAGNGLYIKSVKREGTKITATVKAVGDYDGKSSLVAVGYNVADGLKTTLAASKTGKVETVAKGEEKTVELELSGLTADMYLNLFMYSGNTTDKFAVSAAVHDVK